MINNLVERYRQRWWDAPNRPPEFDRSFTASEQQSNEVQMKDFVDLLSKELDHLPKDEAGRQAVMARLLPPASQMAMLMLGLKEDHLQYVLACGFLDVSTEFARQARRFDPAISGQDIYQASRNLWSANFIQLLMGRPVELTPSIFAYSMLYPYSDNYLDNPNIPASEKAAFNERFRRRLAGENVRPANDHEGRICDLVGMIEAQYSRAEFPQVYQGLMDIYLAQVRSVQLLAGNPAPYDVDVMSICFSKGGTSVLADGYLVAGALTEAELDALFGYGIFTQMVDDLEDIDQDLHSGISTLFSQAGRHWPLDAITSRTFHFGRRVVQSLNCFTAASGAPLKEMLAASVNPMLTASIASLGKYYTTRYMDVLQDHFPLRFSFLKNERRRMERRRVTWERMVDLLE